MLSDRKNALFPSYMYFGYTFVQLKSMKIHEKCKLIEFHTTQKDQLNNANAKETVHIDRGFE